MKFEKENMLATVPVLFEGELRRKRDANLDHTELLESGVAGRGGESPGWLGMSILVGCKAVGARVV